MITEIISILSHVSDYFRSSTRWYRAQVLALLEDGSAEVFYVDYGDKETVGKERLRAIPEKFQQLSFQAIECQLANVTKIGMFVQLVRKDSIEH